MNLAQAKGIIKAENRLATRVRPYEVRIKWINTSLKFSKEIIKVVLINISKLRLLFTVSSTWWSIPDWSIILQHLPSAGQWQTMSLLQDHNVRPYDVHKNKIWSGSHEAKLTWNFKFQCSGRAWACGRWNLLLKFLDINRKE